MTKLSTPAPNGLAGIPFGYDKYPYAPWNTHRGDDWKWRLVDPFGSRKVVASAPGKVVHVYGGGAYNAGYGNRIIIEHEVNPGVNDIVRTTYNHLASGTIKVKPGQLVARGQHLATMGATGEVNGVHLHRELTINSVRVDARKYHSRDIPGTPLTGAVRTVRKDIASLNGRDKPTTKSSKEGDGLKPGKKYRFYYYTYGQKVTVGSGKNKVTSSIWFQGKTGRWYSAAGFTSKSIKGLIKK